MDEDIVQYLARMNNTAPVRPVAPLLPFQTYSESPLTALARTRPQAAERILERMVEVQRETACLDVAAKLSGDATDQICTWLSTRRPGEMRARVRHRTDVTEGGWCGRTVSVRSETTFEINY